MRILFYPPFKPLGHPNPSGDLVIASGLRDFLAGRGHEVLPVESVRARWIYWKPRLWPKVAADRAALIRRARRLRPDLWLTYHTYYKAPDVLGPSAAAAAGLPYVIFQGMFSTKRRRDVRTLPGYMLNRRALLAARRVFTNRRDDLVNLLRLLPEQRVAYLAPGIFPDDFSFSPAGRAEWRREWGVGESPVVASAAMFRPDVKTVGLEWTIRACGRLVRRGMDLYLAIAGDGSQRARLERLAASELNGRVRFAGRVPRGEMHRFYSGGDVFAFPGFRESLGMVYLEAQSCGLPVAAIRQWGLPEVTDDGRTALLADADDFEGYSDRIGRLISDEGLRRSLGRRAADYVRRRHDLNINYRRLEEYLQQTAEGRG